MIILEEGVVTLVESLNRGWVSSVRTLDDCVHQESRDHCSVRIAGNHLSIYNFFCNYDDSLGSTNSFNHDSEISPAMRVALAIGALHVHDSDVRNQGAHGPESFFR